MISNKKIFLVIFFGLIVSVSLSLFNISKFDKNIILKDGSLSHKMIKSDILYHYKIAQDIKNDLENKNYFETGGFFERNYLPSKIFLIFSFISGEELFDDEENKIIVSTNNKKISLLIFQSLFYFLCLYFLCTELSKKTNNQIGLYVCIFLSFEPTILQWHSSFWTESVFLSLQILFLSILIIDRKNNISFLLLGLILGLMFLQRSAAIFYVVPVLLYMVIFFKNHTFKIAYFLFGYFLICSVVGYNNYQRSGVIYFSPGDQKFAFSEYMLPTIISKNEKISLVEADRKISNKKKEIINSNNLNIDIEKDYVLYSQKLRNYSFLYFIQNPIITFNHVIKKSLHFGVLDPVWGYYIHVYDRAGKDYINSKDHSFWIKYRIIYSLLIYIVVAVGLLDSLRKIEIKTNFLLILSLLYFFFILSWMGKTRYFTPCLIYLSIYFSIGLNKILEFKNEKNKLI